MIRLLQIFFLFQLLSCAAINKDYKNVDLALNQGAATNLVNNKIPLGPGGFYSHQQNTKDISKTAKDYESTKMGKSCASSLLGLVSWGDASIYTATKSANISNVYVVDGSSQTILGLWAEYCTVVRGI